jgi:peptidyl-prolyl cis-trans isomerase C
MVTLVVDHAAKRGSKSEHGAGSPDAEKPVEPVLMPVVSVNGVTISRKAIAAEVQNFPARNPGEGWKAATCALVIRELLMQEARRLGISAEPQTDMDGRVETADDALLRALIEQEVQTPHADETTLKRFYEHNRRRFVTLPLYEADHILFAARRDDKEAFAAALEKARSARDLLMAAPEQFPALARECSACPSAALGGSLGQIRPGDTTPEFEAALTALEPGEIAPPVETRYGVHLIRLTRRIDGRELPFEQVRERIETYLNEHVRRQATAQYLSLLIGRADIQGVMIEGATSPLVQ